MTNPRQHRVIVGISGGVDSATAALLLKNQGYQVEGAFMQNWDDSLSSGDCSSSQDLRDAQAVCDHLQIKLHTVNFSKEYWQRVFQHFLTEYSSCRTPNPDVLCNKEIKFKVFLEYVKSIGADFIATGHYAQHIQRDDREVLLKGTDLSKDQTYFLHLLNQQQLAPALFPLGNLTKQEVRAIAKRAALPNHAKKDSTGICFIGERKFKDFLSEYLLDRPGDIVTTEDIVIGSHSGLMFYTIGQRQGLKIGGQKNLPEAPWYVAAKDQKNNILIVTQNREHPALMAKQLTCDQLHWISGMSPALPLECTAKIRHRQHDQRCTVTNHPNKLNCAVVTFAHPQWAITPGQSVVFYQSNECLGGGVIT